MEGGGGKRKGGAELDVLFKVQNRFVGQAGCFLSEEVGGGRGVGSSKLFCKPASGGCGLENHLRTPKYDLQMAVWIAGLQKASEKGEKQEARQACFASRKPH